jgi:DNA modification methylase
VSAHILVGEARALMRTLEPESVQCVVTSFPYWGLRDYGIPPVVWGGDPACAHDFDMETVSGEIRTGLGLADLGKRYRGGGHKQGQIPKIKAERGFCRCSAWRGSFGLEPTYQLYIAHAVEVAREISRVLRNDGTFWLNLGDCYASGAGQVGEHPGGGERGARWKGEAPTRGYRADRLANGRVDQDAILRVKTRATRDGTHAGKHTAMAAIGPMTQPNRIPQPGLKPKSLVGIPWRVALALQDDGWILRRDIIWHKPAPMPESTRDRCTTAHEYIFHFSKRDRYYYDRKAIAEPCSSGTHARRSIKMPDGWDTGAGAHGSYHRNGREKGKTRKLAAAGSGTKNNDSFDAAMAIMPSHRNKRSVWTVGTSPFPEAHFATFPPNLIRPCILAGAPKGGLVLDPFAGAGTVGVVCEEEGRDALLIELNPAYAEMAERRVAALRMGPEEKKRARIKQKDKLKPAHELPLFGRLRPSELREAAE